MTYDLKIDYISPPTISVGADVKFPAAVVGDAFITITYANGGYQIGADYTILDPAPITDPSATIIAVWDAASQSWKQMTLADVINGTGTTPIQIVTGAGDVTVAPATRVLIMNRTVDESPSKINLPAGALKVGDVKVVDWKGNSGTYPHDIYPAGSEKFNGNQPDWTLGGDGASLVFDPIPSLGYAV